MCLYRSIPAIFRFFVSLFKSWEPFFAALIPKTIGSRRLRIYHGVRACQGRWLTQKPTIGCAGFLKTRPVV
jgi:hypothetical protein